MNYEIHHVDGITMEDPQGPPPVHPDPLQMLFDEWDKTERHRMLDNAKEQDDDA